MAKVLIIEDDKEVRELLDIFLTKKGFEVLSTPSGKEGIGLVKRSRPDLVIVDARLPNLNGIEVLREIRGFEKKTKIVMVSGLDTGELEEEARQAGASAFLPKNLGIDAIVNTITDMLS